ncbi:MAG: gliding motility-associated C-terminal domain-containing protein [Bacteroidia bacterium]|nr:gliding motility-associated C-terminal domain-containing protein [Bacteroidia bacterium]
MNLRLRHIIIWLTLVCGTNLRASHILGGEITYKHLKNNQYKITLNIYRDCNGCKINGNGGGNTSENCSEIDYVYIKSTDDSISKEVKFALKRESVTDITPICATRISACSKNSNTVFGIELQSFSATIDLDNDLIKGYCKYVAYIVIAERNSDITTGQAKQNFCIDAMINTCVNKPNNSPEIISKPVFIFNSNKPVFLSFGAKDNDDDSLVYTLIPANSGFGKNIKYNTGFSYNKPLTVYCTDVPCIPNKNLSLPVGFYFDNSNGENVFIPISESERAVIVVKIEDYKKISGKWVLAGYIKRDIQIYVKSNEGNNTPIFTSKSTYEVCEGEELKIKITAKDEKNNITNNFDSLSFSLITNLNKTEFTQYSQTDPPYKYATLKWKAPKDTVDNNIINLWIKATDNNCPINFSSFQNLKIKVIPKIDLKINKTFIGCGNYELKALNIENYSIFNLTITDLQNNNEIFKTSNLIDTVSQLPNGTYLVNAQIINENGCISTISDTLYNFQKSNAYIIGDSLICKKTEHKYSVINNFHTKAKTEWYFDNSFIGASIINVGFEKNGILKSISTYAKGKWSCEDTLYKIISIIENPKILSPDTIEICHNSGFFNLYGINISPANGVWTSESPLFLNDFINTNDSFPYIDKEIKVIYTSKNISGCIASKSIEIIINAIPEFELNSVTICEKSTSIWLSNLIKKPYNKLDFTYNWKINGFKDIIRELNDNKYVLSSDLGLGIHKISGKITGKNSCTNFDSTIIEITPSVTIKFENEIIVCQNSGNIDINKVSGVSPATGAWSFVDFPLFDDKNNIKTDTCGIFEATYIYDNYGCFDSKKTNIKIICTPEIKINITKDAICEKKLPLSLYATPDGGIWEGKYINYGNIFNPPTSDKNEEYLLKYKVKKDKCVFEKKNIITVLPTPKINLTTNKYMYCDEEPIYLKGIINNADILTANYNNENFKFNISRIYSFDNANIYKALFKNTNPNEEQYIIITANNNEGCADSVNLFFKVLEKPKITKLRDTAFCENISGAIIPETTYSSSKLNYDWELNNSIFSNNNFILSNNLNRGKNHITYTVKSDNCYDKKTIEVTINKAPLVEFIIIPSDENSILKSEFEFINQSEKNLEYLWNFGSKGSNNSSNEENPKFRYTDTGIYKVTLKGTNEFGCSEYYSKEIKVIPEILIFIPNAFSPNNKGTEENNSFGITINHYKQFNMQIFDRWGHKVYSSENPQEKWDGKSGNVKCTPDIYVYNIEVLSVSGITYKYRGTITLIK